MKFTVRAFQLFFKIVFHTFNFLIVRGKAKIGIRNGAYEADLGNAIKNLFESLGPSFLKIGQLLSMRADIVNPNIINTLKELQDNVTPAPPKIIYNTLENAYGDRMSSIFIKFNFQPIASGSIAQVHYAILKKEGKPVAVKIKRQGLRKQITQDISIIHKLVRLLTAFKYFQHMPLTGMIKQIGISLLQQLDFEKEIENNYRFQEMFKNNDSIILPKIYPDFSTEEIIVMEFIEGFKRFDDLSIEISDFQRLAKIGIHVLYKMVFTTGFVHCDLHAANIGVNYQRDLVILDTGFVAEVKEETLTLFRQFFIGIISNNGKKCSQILFETSSSQGPGFVYQNFENDVIKLISKNARLATGEFNVGNFSYQLFDIQRKHQLEGAIEFIMTILSMLVVEGLVKFRWPEMKFQELAIPYLSTSVLHNLVGKQ